MPRRQSTSTRTKPRRTPVTLGPGDAEIWTWLDRFASCVRTRDFAGARALFVRDTLGFGTVAGRLTTIDQLIARQWKRVWPNISRFCEFLRAIWPNPLGARTRLVRYEDLGRFRPDPGLYIFTDIELMDDDLRRKAADLHAELSARPRLHRVWNHPLRSARRFELLERLAATGQNRFRAYRLDAPLPSSVRYPVFLRDEHEHLGPRTPLLPSEAALRTALAELRAGARPHGPLLAVEFLDYADAAGVYRKYSTFRLDDRFIPRHLLFSRSWSVKYEDAQGIEEPWLHEERMHLQSNEREAEIRAIFDAASLDYGRIDYTLVEGRIQVFEINSNPVLLRPEHLAPGPRREGHLTFANALIQALDQADPTRPVPFGKRLSWRLMRPQNPFWRRHALKLAHRIGATQRRA